MDREEDTNTLFAQGSMYFFLCGNSSPKRDITLRTLGAGRALTIAPNRMLFKTLEAPVCRTCTFRSPFRNLGSTIGNRMFCPYRSENDADNGQLARLAAAAQLTHLLIENKVLSALRRGSRSNPSKFPDR